MCSHRWEDAKELRELHADPLVSGAVRLRGFRKLVLPAPKPVCATYLLAGTGQSLAFVLWICGPGSFFIFRPAATPTRWMRDSFRVCCIGIICN